MTRKRKMALKLILCVRNVVRNKNRIKKGQQKNGHFLIAMKDVNVVENL